MPSELEGNITLSSNIAHQLFSLTSSLIISIPPLQDLKSVRRFRNDNVVMQKVRHFEEIMQEITDVQRILQHSVDRLKQQVCAVHNAKADVARLPDELLQLIFHHIVDQQQRNWLGYTDEPEEPKRSTLLSCTHVCQKWRDVALATSSLWEWVNPDWSLVRVSTWLTRVDSGMLMRSPHMWESRRILSPWTSSRIRKFVVSLLPWADPHGSEFRPPPASDTFEYPATLRVGKASMKPSTLFKKPLRL